MTSRGSTTRRAASGSTSEGLLPGGSRYIEDIRALGYEPAILADLKVHHTGGRTTPPSPRRRSGTGRAGTAAMHKTAVKRALLLVPFVRRLNARHGWFVEP